LEVLAEALAVMDTTEARFYAAELYRLKGALLLQQAVPDAVQAETCFHQALAVARQQQAKSFELRAATSLARLWQSQGSARRLTTCSPRCTTGSPRGLIRRISKRRRHCWTNTNPKDITCEVCIGQLRRHPAALNRPRKTEEGAA